MLLSYVRSFCARMEQYSLAGLAFLCAESSSKLSCNNKCMFEDNKNHLNFLPMQMYWISVFTFYSNTIGFLYLKTKTLLLYRSLCCCLLHFCHSINNKRQTDTPPCKQFIVCIYVFSLLWLESVSVRSQIAYFVSFALISFALLCPSVRQIHFARG